MELFQVIRSRFVCTAVMLCASGAAMCADETPVPPAPPVAPKVEAPTPPPAVTPETKPASVPAVAAAAPATGAAPAKDEPKPETPAVETPKAPADTTAAVPAVPAIKFTKDPDAPPPADIFAAAKSGDLEAVQQFVDRDATTLQQKTQLSDTALHWASSCGHADVVKYLLSKGSDPNLQNMAGATPLHLAARKAYVDVIKALIHSKANPNLKNFLEDGEETPLHIAIQNGNLEVIELLLNGGADVNARMTDGTRPMDIAEKRPTSDVRKLLVKFKGTSNATEEE